eukprot:GFUD01031591.1.p1 GENE.GFUD01031591.1~~GFUD01031591.1.p1  ORF type:complete len:466 (-),score=158.84 GFUD01031591.1:1141-2538(-)
MEEAVNINGPNPSPTESCHLHQAVFKNDLPALSALLRGIKDKNNSTKIDIAGKDLHGNTALHLAVMLGRRECAQLLLAHGAPVKLKNTAGWSPLAEAISYGERQTIASLLRRLKQQAKSEMGNRRPDMIEGLRNLGDFTLELKWDFSSWVPLVSRILPSDICKISKRGASVRLDTTLVDFSEMRWERGDITFLYRGDEVPEHSLCVLDNKAGVYQYVRHQESELEFEDEVDLLMSSDIVAAQISTKPITFTREKAGWIWREDRAEQLGNYQADFYTVNGMVLESRKRREHLSEEDLQKNRAIIDSFSKGNTQAIEVDPAAPAEPTRRESLVPPPTPGVTWAEYSACPAGQPPQLGRKIVSKISSKQFKATVAMSEDFPMKVDMLLAVLEVIAPQFKHFNKLRDFVTLKLPPGFPIQVNIPVLPTVSAKVTFTDFKWTDAGDDGQEQERFQVPDSYSLDPYRFPDL